MMEVVYGDGRVVDITPDPAIYWTARVWAKYFASPDMEVDELEAMLEQAVRGERPDALGFMDGSPPADMEWPHGLADR